MGRVRRLLIPGLSTLAMLVVLLGLGTWQVERLGWKSAVLARIDAAEAAPAVPLGPAMPADFTKVRVEGVLRPELSVLYGAEGRNTLQGMRMGGRLVSVLERAGAKPLLVDRGWVESLPPAAAPGPARFEGYVRPGDRPGMFSASDDPAARRFFTLDPAAIARALGVGPVDDVVLVAMGSAAAGQPEPASSLPRPANNHLSYAITWYGLALALVVIFVVYARKVPDDRV